VDLPTAVEKYWTQAAALGAAVFTAWRWWVERRDRRRLEAEAERTARASAKLDLTRLAQEAAGDVVQILREEVGRLAEELSDVRTEMREMQREHIQMIAGKDAELAVARGQIRQLETKCETYRRLLADHGIHVPLAFEAQQVRPDGNLKTMGATE
jgi:DNA repair exonuclease SbcCD ATPase subunit